MIELDTIYNEDCLTGMQRIPDGSVDCIICDLPYGTMKGIDDNHDWDVIIPTEELFAAYDRVLRQNGMCILFSQEPYTMHLRTYPKKSNITFCYPMIWKKDRAGNHLNANRSPMSFFEDINVFVKPYDSNGINPLRNYFAKVLSFIGKTKAEVIADLGKRADHVLRVDSSQWRLDGEDTYTAMIQQYNIDKMEGFRAFADLKRENEEYKKSIRRVFNLPVGKNSMSNVLEFPKDKNGLHPTQKPVDLIRKLVEVYSNPGDTILDNCMGSGTTAIACMRTNRNYLGFELNRDYYDIALRRINLEQQQTTLF